MPTYVYESKDGHRVEEVHPISSYPKSLNLKGKRYELVITGGGGASVSKDIEHIACTLPPWTPGAREYVTDSKHVHYGQPIVRNQRDRRNIEAASAGEGKAYVHDSRTDRSRPFTKPR